MCWRGHPQRFETKKGCKLCLHAMSRAWRDGVKLDRMPKYRINANYFKARVNHQIQFACCRAEVSYSSVVNWLYKRLPATEKSARRFAEAMRIPFNELWTLST
jgi:hypothetical protein